MMNYALYEVRGSSDRTSSRPVAKSIEEPKYKYKKVDFDKLEIRVLKLSAKPTPAYGSVVHISLIDPPPYVALSYCWGDSKKTHSIYLDDERVKITPNLSRAIEEVKKTRYAINSDSFLLWADALCINQDDNEERSQQVRYMRQIYSRATEVLCWVGESSNPLALENLVTNSETQIYGDQFEHSREIINHFFDLPYWRRVWVIQEIAVAESVTVLWGRAAVDSDYGWTWTQVANFIKRLMAEGTELERRKLVQLPVHLVKIRERFMDPRGSIRLFDAIHWTTATLSTDPRDKIFALLGLCQDGVDLVPVPNYRQPLETILQDMSRLMMRRNRSLDLICMRGVASPGKSTLPSWVPDWPNIWSSGMTMLESKFDDWSHHPSQGSTILQAPSKDILKVRGRHVADVKTVSSKISVSKLGEEFPYPYWLKASFRLNSRDVSKVFDLSHAKFLRFYDAIWKG
jgi:hypothetical protein